MNDSADISVVIPVLQEEERICAAVAALCAQSFAGQAQVIVVDGDPQGSSIRALEQLGCVPSRADPERYNEHFLIQTCTSDPGRARQMNQGARLAKARAVLFLHADTALPAGALDLIVDSLKTSDAGAFRLHIDHPGWGLRLIEGMANLRSRASRTPYGDQAIFLRREVFSALGGYETVPIMEELMLLRKLNRKGYKLRIVPAAVSVSARRWLKEGLLYCTLRNWALTALFYLGVHPVKLARMFQYNVVREPTPTGPQTDSQVF